jgi:branched-chain amino acid transport system substrate-binding protein
MLNRVLFFIVVLFTSPLTWSVETIKIGMTTALTGPAAELGFNMRTGIECYFDMVNKQGGVAGRQLDLIVLDDGYEPVRAALNMRKLIDQEKVLAVIGNVGTPTAIVTAPIAQEKKTLLFGAFSGGDVLRPTPVNRYIINYRPSYVDETAEIVRGLLQAGIKPLEIALFTQRDGYGDAGFQGVMKAFHEFGFENTDQLAHGRYTRNTLNVENAVALLLEGPSTPKAVIMAGGYAASAKFIKLLRREIPDVIFVNLSFVGGYSLKQALGDVESVIVMQSVPPLESNLPIVQLYLSSLHKFDVASGPRSVSLEGFIVAKIFHQGLLNIEGNITKESIIDGLELLHDIDIGLGVDIYIDENQHQAIHNVWMTHFKAGKITSFSWSMLQKQTIRR